MRISRIYIQSLSSLSVENVNKVFVFSIVDDSDDFIKGIVNIKYIQQVYLVIVWHPLYSEELESRMSVSHIL